MYLHQNTQFHFLKGHHCHLSNGEIVDHSPNSHQLVYIMNGEIDLRSHSEKKKIQARNLCLIPAKSEALLSSSSQCQLYLCEFTAETHLILDLLKLLHSHPTAKAENPTLTEEIFKQLINFDNDDFQQTTLLSTLLYPLLKNTQENSVNRELFRLIPVLEYIEENIKYSPRLIDLANLMELDKVYFTSLFRKTLGFSPGQYIQQRKIKTACNMLLNNMTVSQITQELDFYDTSHFCRIFKKEMNETPKQFLKRNQQ